MFEVAKGDFRLKEDMMFFFDEHPLMWMDVPKGHGDTTNKSDHSCS
jgi:hypothetical protein